MKPSRVKRFLIALAIAAVVLVAAVIAAVPYAVPTLAEHLIAEKAWQFGLNVRAKMHLGYCWRNGPGIEGSLSVSVPGTVWKLRSEFAASACEWMATLTVPETEFHESEPLVRELLERYPVPGVTNLTFSGSVAVQARAERSYRVPVPKWEVKVPVRNLDVGLISKDRPVAVDDLSLTLGASGIADHYDIRPMFLKASSACFSGLAVTNMAASVRATERGLMISELNAGFCGGTISVYSLFIDPKSLNTGFTLFLENVETGRLLGYLKSFKGEASGRLHGKLKAYVKEGGCAVYLRDAFVYSTPGQNGKIRVHDAEKVADGLAMTGLDESARKNVADALTDLDYSVLRLDLDGDRNGEMRLSIQLRGTAERKGVSVPVDLTINLNGELGQIINTGLGLSAKRKGTKR